MAHKVWIITTRDTFGENSITEVFDNEAAAQEYARNAYGAQVHESSVRSDCPDWAKDHEPIHKGAR